MKKTGIDINKNPKEIAHVESILMDTYIGIVTEEQALKKIDKIIRKANGGK